MGSMTFTRLDNQVEGNELGRMTFDSSPQYSICKRFGLDPDKFKMEETSRSPNKASYDVFGGQRTSKAVGFIGRLEWERPLYLQD